MNRRYGCYISQRQVSHQKPHDGSANVTDVTDVTPNRRGCTWRASAGASARSRHIDTPLSNTVTSVTSVTSPAPYCGFRVSADCNTGDHVTPAAGSGASA